jgi:leader peptidase (prepilin peptidase)/N-methyltransferase
MTFLPIVVFLGGLLIGSFLNVVILRMNTGRSVVTGRSACARCNRTLMWYELIPVVSFLGLRGKCRTCRQGISFQYPIVELCMGIYAVLAYTVYVLGGTFSASAWVTFFFAVSIAAMLLVVTVYDLRHKVIPDAVVYPFILISFVSIIWRAMGGGFDAGKAIVDGVVVALPFFLLWYLSKGKLIGFGDVKLMLGIGWLVGLMMGYSVMVFAFWIGAVVGLILIAVSRKHGMKSQVPFGPFLIAGLFIVTVWGVTLQTLFPLLW